MMSGCVHLDFIYLSPPPHPLILVVLHCLRAPNPSPCDIHQINSLCFPCVILYACDNIPRPFEFKTHSPNHLPSALPSCPCFTTITTHYYCHYLTSTYLCAFELSSNFDPPFLGVGNPSGREVVRHHPQRLDNPPCFLDFLKLPSIREVVQTYPPPLLSPVSQHLILELFCFYFYFF